MSGFTSGAVVEFADGTRKPVEALTRRERRRMRARRVGKDALTVSELIDRLAVAGECDPPVWLSPWLSVAFETGQIPPFDAAQVHQAVRELQRWLREAEEHRSAAALEGVSWH